MSKEFIIFKIFLYKLYEVRIIKGRDDIDLWSGGVEMISNQFNNETQKKPNINSPKTPVVSSHEPVPIEIKKKVIDRAKKICEYKGCRENKFLEFHHKNLKNNDNSTSNIELLCSRHHILRHIEKTRKTISYDILTGQKITRNSKKPKKTTKRKTFKKPIKKRRTPHKKTSRHILNKTLDNL